MKVNLHTPIEEAQVQLIPLIDVIFCILTFFILASLQFTRQQAINVDLPKANSATASSVVTSPGGRDILPVTIDAVNQLYVEKQPVEREQLTAILKRYLQQNPKGTVVLNASKSATYSSVIEMLELLRQVGGDRVSLGIIPGSSSTPNTPSYTSPSFPVNPNVPGAVPPTTPVLPQIPNVPLPPPSSQITPVNPAPVLPQVPASPAPKR